MLIIGLALCSLAFIVSSCYLCCLQAALLLVWIDPKKGIDFVFGDFSLEPLTGTPQRYYVLVGINCISKISPHLCLCYFTANLIWTFQNDSTSLHFCLVSLSHLMFPLPSLGLRDSAEENQHIFMCKLVSLTLACMSPGPADLCVFTCFKCSL